MTRLVGWYEVLRGLRLTLGYDPMYNPAFVWLNLAAEADRQGLHQVSEALFTTALVREAYDADPYTPPPDLKLRYGQPRETPR